MSAKSVRTVKDVDIIVACDKGNMTEISKIVDPLEGVEGIWVKLGYVPMFGVGLETLSSLRRRGFRLFLDAKLNDIPNTVAEATKIAAHHGFHAINVHASSGLESMKAVVAAREGLRVFAVTVLTSIDEGECISIFGDNPGKKVVQFAFAAHEAGVDGIICSPQEGAMLRRIKELSELLIWTPGIRSKDATPDDQRRTMTAGEAALFADGLVIGRPITAAPDPTATIEAFRIEISEALAAKAQADLEASWPVYVLTYSSPYEFDDDEPSGMCGHEICWSHDHKHEFHAKDDKMARELADEFINDPSGVVVVGRERASRQLEQLRQYLATHG